MGPCKFQNYLLKNPNHLVIETFFKFCSAQNCTSFTANSKATADVQKRSFTNCTFFFTRYSWPFETVPISQIHCAVNSNDSSCKRLDVLCSICLSWYTFLIEPSDERPMIRTCSVILVLFVLIDTANRPASISYSGRNYPRQIRAKCNSWSAQNKKRVRNKGEEKIQEESQDFLR